MANASSDQTIAERHATSIGRWVACSWLVACVAAWFLLAPQSSSLPLRLLYALSAAFAFNLVSSRVSMLLHARSFVRQLVAAELHAAPSIREPEPVHMGLSQDGFQHYGSWMVVGSDGAVFAGAGSRLYYRHEDLTMVYTHATQIIVATALSDGRKLLTVSVGAVPHARNVVQGIKYGEVGELVVAHRAGLNVLAAEGIVAVEPPGGPVDFYLDSSRIDQEWAASQSLNAAAAALGALAEQELTLLAETPPEGTPRVPA